MVAVAGLRRWRGRGAGDATAGCDRLSPSHLSSPQVIIHLVFEIALYGITDVCIQGFGCDRRDANRNLSQPLPPAADVGSFRARCDNLRDGNFLLCVRHCGKEDARALAGSEVELPPKPSSAGKLFKLGRVKAVIDVMVEPLSPTSVRFSYSCSQPIPKLAPSWIVSMVMKRGMGDIFARMKAACRAMASGDARAAAKYPIVKRIRSPAYAHVIDDIAGRVKGYLNKE